MIKIFRRLWIATTILIALVVVAEFGLRRTFPAFDPDRQFHMIPGIGSAPTLAPPLSLLRQRSPVGDYDVPVAINAYGLREPKSMQQADSSAIYVVGDQFPFGAGVAEDKRFSNLLEKRLNVSVYNISMRGNLPWGHFKLIDYVERVVRYAREPNFQIGKLVLVLPLEYEIQRYQNNASSPVVAPSSSGPSVRQWLADNLSLYMAAQYVVQQNDFLRNAAIRLGLVSKFRRVVASPSRDDEAIRQTVEQLQKIAALRNTVFVIVPSPAQLLPDQADAYKSVHDAFFGQLSAAGLAYVDLLPALEKAGGDKVLFPHELYWNEQAHAVTAKVLAPILTENGFSKK